MKFGSVIRIAAYLSLAAAWELLSRSGATNSFLLPPLSAVLSSLFLNGSRILLEDIPLSLQRVLVGFFLTALTAIPLGVALGRSPRLRYFFLPLLQVIRPIPPIAWIPISILWLGLGNAASYFITMLASFFPVLMNSYLASLRIEPEHLHAARSLGASRRQLYLEVALPAVAPQIFSGLRIGLGVAWMSLIASEIASSNGGLGYRMQVHQEMLQIDRVLAGMLVIGAVGWMMDGLIALVQSRILPWHKAKEISA
jgi:ABC-type nitrate/sulfonate/bicarbonate transport system permease component